MTKFDNYLVETAKETIKSDEDAKRPEGISTTLEQRVCCALAEARCVEAKYLANEFRAKFRPADRAAAHLVQKFVDILDARARHLSERAMKLVDKYPPEEPETAKVTLQ